MTPDDRSRNHHHRAHRPWRSARRDFHSRRRAGWGFNLYRNKAEGRIGGVAAGLADYWDVAPWVVRLLWVALFLFTGTLALWLYVAAWFLLAPRPTRGGASAVGDEERGEVPVEMEYDERHHDYRPRKVFRYSEPGTVRLRRARERLDEALRRVENMESYVTSRQYRLNREISRL